MKTIPTKKTKTIKIILTTLSLCCITLFTKAQTTFTASTLQGDTVKSDVMIKAHDITATGIEATDTIKAHDQMVAEKNLAVQGDINLTGKLKLSNTLG